MRPARWPSPLLENLKFGPSFFLATLEFEGLPLQRNGVAEEELRGVLEYLWENIPEEVLIERI